MDHDYRFHHLALIARNYDQTVSWYKRHFGFSVAKEWTVPEMLPGARMCYLKRGSFHFEIIGDGQKTGHHTVASGPLQDYFLKGAAEPAAQCPAEPAAQCPQGQGAAEPAAQCPAPDSSLRCASMTFSARCDGTSS